VRPLFLQCEKISVVGLTCRGTSAEVLNSRSLG
jgi:hypothetical protein